MMKDITDLLEQHPSIPEQYRSAAVRLVVTDSPGKTYFGLAPDMVCHLAAPDANETGKRLLDAAREQGSPVFLDVQLGVMPLYRQVLTAGVEVCIDISRYSIWNMFDREIIRAGLPSLALAHDLFANEASRVAFRGVLAYRITGEPARLSFASYPVYLHPEVLPVADDVLVDGGAFTGDTLRYLLPRLGCLRGVAFEPDADNYDRLVCTIKELDLAKYVRPIQAGLWHEDGEVSFKRLGDSSHIVSCGAAEQAAAIAVRSLDSVAKSFFLRPGFVKLDIEGAEFEALQGAERTLAAARPKLAVCLYHRPEHLWQIPLWLHERGYSDLYLGHHSDGYSVALDTVLYGRAAAF